MRWRTALTITHQQYSLTITHTWAHLVLATHMKAGWVDSLQVAQRTLKIRAHTIASLIITLNK